MKKFIEYIYYSNLWIALGAVALLWTTVYSFELIGEFRPISLFVFFSTLFSYSLHRLYPVFVGGRDPSENQHLQWIWVHRIEGIAVLMLSAFASLYIFLFFLSGSAQVVLFFAGLITLFYSIPIFHQEEGPKIRLRDFPFVKIFLIALIWAMSCVLLPWIESQRLVPWYSIALSIVEKILFLIAITIPFDIRDYAYDKEVEVKTIPQLLGFKKSIRLAIVLCFVCIALVIINFGILALNRDLSALAALSIAYLLTAFAISKTTAYRGDWFYLGILDGTFILQFTLLYILL